jgi:flagellar assembly factor FliW
MCHIKEKELMMKVNTKHFGEVEVEESKIITFEEGLFGFEDQKQFVILFDNERESSPFCWIQSLDDIKVALPAIKPELYYPDYNPEIGAYYIEKIGEIKEEDLDLFSIVVVPEDIKKMTTNLKAPVIVNIKTKKGIQVIAEGDTYNIKENLYQQIKLANEAGE